MTSMLDKNLKRAIFEKVFDMHKPPIYPYKTQISLPVYFKAVTRLTHNLAAGIFR